MGALHRGLSGKVPRLCAGCGSARQLVRATTFRTLAATLCRAARRNGRVRGKACTATRTTTAFRVEVRTTAVPCRAGAEFGLLQFDRGKRPSRTSLRRMRRDLPARVDVGGAAGGVEDLRLFPRRIFFARFEDGRSRRAAHHLHVDVDEVPVPAFHDQGEYPLTSVDGGSSDGRVDAAPPGGCADDMATGKKLEGLAFRDLLVVDHPDV